MIGINVGSGQRPFKSVGDALWFNVDVNPKWMNPMLNTDIIASGDRLPMTDNYADTVVSHHCIEHVGLGEFDGHIREAHRILKPRGSLIITTPNLRSLVDRWTEGRITNYTFCVNLYGAYMNNEADRHKWLYTPQTLKNAVNASGVNWSCVKPFDFRSISGADIAQDWWIQGIEAIK